VRAIGVTRSSLALAAVLVPYWLPAVVALRWGVYNGGDPIELGLALQRYGHDLLVPPFGAYGVVVIPLVVGETAAAVWTLARTTRIGRTANDPSLWLAVLLGVPYVLLLLVYAVILVLFLFSCLTQSCSWVL
jgi:hypothetical protein